MKKIAIQGIKGCFHHIAALEYFDKDPFEILECSSFKKLIEALILDKVKLGIMAIENSIAGSILSNYNLLSDYNIKVLGEIYMPIEQHLMALPGQKINTIHEVFSHPVALQQCAEFLHKYPHIKISEYTDTAEAAHDIMKKRLTCVGAIASLQAAQEYGLEVLAENIHSIPNNYTRFFIIGPPNFRQITNEFDKASFKFNLPDKTGSLAGLLNIITEENMNMTKIQSVPIIEKPWEYSFYIDLIIKDRDAYERIKFRFKKQMCEFSILGQYKNGRSL
ncbi:prephenate dehydratase [Bacteroidetes bacterium endosymbiont of Geopemphigus sp.]|uniref:prephenate dehydratase n=1 Tax=Bacteroidetes bacterium endosymbiont of Geopemphigus sp. TaxID=2047937 RepID=UPI000CD2A001|nr:prephenate dehydratase [Bacteroidetes bacterium endosymbiont of Geopemphigus sp.]